MNVICRFCSASRFQGERLNCCHNGNVRLPSLQECPLLLRRLLESDNREARNYRDNTRNYNAVFSFASFGADVIMPPGRGPYCFRLQGQTYHFISGLHPNNDERRKYGQVIDRCLPDITSNDETFGGKTILLEGDFRQILPVVPHAPPVAVLDVCLKRSHQWPCFEQLKLTTNVRINQQEQTFSQWLLQLGSGLLNSQLDNVPQDTIDIPNESVCKDSLIVDIFYCTPQEMEQQVVLSPKNIDSLAINENILTNIPGETKTYLSTDST
ncbi:DNA helicase Pif1-like [Trinorchestia longiramus]|nr:DNA helicase Pif1-like [Trinorchestia longiramus]